MIPVWFVVLNYIRVVSYCLMVFSSNTAVKLISLQKYIVTLIPNLRCFSRIIWCVVFTLHFIIQITLLINIHKVAIGLLSLWFLCKHYCMSNNRTICNIDVILMEIISGLYHIPQHDSCINFCAKLLVKLVITSHRNLWMEICIHIFILFTPVAPFTKMDLTLILAWISNHMPSKVWDEIT